MLIVSSFNSLDAESSQVAKQHRHRGILLLTSPDEKLTLK